MIGRVVVSALFRVQGLMTTGGHIRVRSRSVAIGPDVRFRPEGILRSRNRAFLLNAIQFYI